MNEFITVQDEWKYGCALWDQHYGIPRKLVEVTNFIQLSVDGSSEVLQAILDGIAETPVLPHNKLVVLVGETMDGEFQAAYSYDNRYLGLLTFKLKGNL